MLAQAVQDLFPEAKLGIGPPIENGFYYDFDVETPFHPADLEKLETRMRKIIKEHYRLDDAALNVLVAAGETAESEAIDFYRFTSEIKRHLSEAQRVELVGMLWEIVYADGARSEMEDHAIWRIADLLGVSGRDRVLKRREAAAKIDMVEEENEAQQES